MSKQDKILGGLRERGRERICQRESWEGERVIQSELHSWKKVFLPSGTDFFRRNFPNVEEEYPYIEEKFS